MCSRPVAIPGGDGQPWGCPGGWQLPLQAPVMHTYARGRDNRNVRMHGVCVGVGVPRTGRLGASRFKNRKGKSITDDRGTHRTWVNRQVKTWL